MGGINQLRIVENAARHDRDLNFSATSGSARGVAGAPPVAHPQTTGDVIRTLDDLYRNRTAPMLILDLPIATVRELFPGASLRGKRASKDGGAGQWFSATRKRSLQSSDYVRAAVKIKPKDATRLHDKEPEYQLLALYDPAGKAKTYLPKGYDAVHEFEAYQNPAVFKKGRMKRGFGRVAHRYGQYFKGAADTLAGPRQMGLILANLGVTSITLSAFLYGALYLLDYATVESSVCRPHPTKQKQNSQADTQVNGPAAMMVA